MSQFVVRSRASQTTQLSAPQTTRSSSSSGTPPPLLPQGLKDKLARLAGEAHVGGRNIACYGFDQPRSELKGEIIGGRTSSGDKLGWAFTMNELNRKIGISDTTSVINVLEFFQSYRSEIQSKSVDERVAFYCDGYISPPDPNSLEGKWLHFLMEHVESVDILSKLSNLVEASEKPATRGPLPPHPSRLDYVKGSSKRLNDVLLSFLCKNKKGKGLYSPPEAVKALVTGLKASPHSVSDFLEPILATALFRQTSKLGLRFCAEQKIPVAFSWEQYDESPLTGWLQKPTAGSRRAIQSFVPITGSEMRMIVSEPTIQGSVTTIQRGHRQNDFTQPEGVQRRNKLS